MHIIDWSSDECSSDRLGIAQIKAGTISVNQTPIKHPRPYIATSLGVAIVPQGRCIIENLSVEENLVLGSAANRAGPWTVSAIYKLFPILQERAHTPGTALSGGQQQIGRAHV